MSLIQIKEESIENESITQTKLSGSISFSNQTSPMINTVQITDSNFVAIDDTAVPLDGGYIKITGSNFDTSAVIWIDTTLATSQTIVSSTVIHAQIPAKAAGTYKIYLVNPDGSAVIGVDGVTYSPFPVWTTNATLIDAAKDEAYSVQLGATDAITYALAAGSSLPPGLSLSSSGLLSGTVTGITDTTTYSFTVVATDAESQDTSRPFSLTVMTSLYDFTNVTFSSEGLTGRYGPTLSQAISKATSTGNIAWKNNVEYFNITATGIILWKVPANGTYRIEVWGAPGGGGGYSGGKGARMRGDFYLTNGETIKILVGQVGGASYGGGGGGTFIAKNNNTPLIVAGGGNTASPWSSTIVHASTDTSGTGGSVPSYNGTGGMGGSAASGSAAGGAGFTGNGVNTTCGSSIAPLSFINGGTGGQTCNSIGGFGGGSATDGCCYGASGAGGGYSGGAGCSSSSQYGGAGGSYNSGTNQSNDNGNTGTATLTFGKAVITKL